MVEEEKRQHARRPARRPVQLLVPGSTLSGAALITDFSYAGLGMRTAIELLPGTPVTIKAAVDANESPPIISTAHVVRCEPAGGRGQFALGCSLD